MSFFQIIKNFILTKRYFYFLPRKLRLKIFNLKKLKLYKTSTGKYYLPQYAYKDLIRNEIINNMIFDKKVFDVGKSIIKENSIVLDVGSNFGQMSVLFSKLGNNIEVYSFEASKYLFEILTKNVEINEANVKLFNNLVGNISSTKFNIKQANLSKFNTYGSNKIEIVESLNNKNNSEIESVQSIKIDDIIFDKKISFMKVDVQGFDLEVLKGAKNTILNNKMPIVFEYEKDFEKDFGYKFEDFEKFIFEINYKIKSKIDNSNFLIVSN